MKKLYLAQGYTQDGYLEPNEGRIVIYERYILASKGNYPDHMSLLQSLAARYHLMKDDVISNAMRLYYAKEEGDVIVTPSRKLDFDDFSENQEAIKLVKVYFKLIEED